jgi:phosphate transport system ATP-binding protein
MTAPTPSHAATPRPAANRPVATVRAPEGAAEPGRVILDVTGLNAYFGSVHAVRNVSIPFREREVTAIIGPSGCGKSTMLRCLNRMHETVPGARVTGQLEFHEQDLYAPEVNPIEVRRHIGMVFQRPTPFPTLCIRDNVSAGIRAMRRGQRPPKSAVDEIVETALRDAALWDEVKDRLGDGAIGLSGGQQQRLCIARALATSPTVLLLDEPTASLDPLSTQKVEELVYSLRKKVTVIIVTHNMQQAARVSDRTAFMLNGELVEVAPTGKLFTTPADPRTEAYVTGRFG